MHGVPAPESQVNAAGIHQSHTRSFQWDRELVWGTPHLGTQLSRGTEDPPPALLWMEREAQGPPSLETAPPPAAVRVCPIFYSFSLVAFFTHSFYLVLVLLQTRWQPHGPQSTDTHLHSKLQVFFKVGFSK